ncbi:MAG: YigZ family protein [Lachnospiraceae bacterium]|nr:YigZ family protein [Lachnospiraceae bacterium]
MSDYKILKKGGDGEIVEKKSRFIAHIVPVENKEEAMDFVASMKKKYYDARHNCYAYTIGPNDEEFKSSDDGEPSGTAGRPMLEVIKGEGIHNICVVVTRYFGGVLLGTGGLVRAYTEAVKEGLRNCEVATLCQGMEYLVEVSYPDLGKLQNYCRNENITIEDEQYGEKVLVELILPVEGADKFEKDLQELYAGKVVPEKMGEKSFAKVLSM